MLKAIFKDILTDDENDLYAHFKGLLSAG